MFWVGATVMVMAWVDQQNGRGVGLAQKGEGRAGDTYGWKCSKGIISRVHVGLWLRSSGSQRRG